MKTIHLSIICSLIILAAVLSSCRKDESDPPALFTLPVAPLAETSALSGGEIRNDGGSPVTARGVCWSTSHNPTVDDAHTSDSSGTGIYQSTITGLQPETTYYVRAYATNLAGTAYGQERFFNNIWEQNGIFIDTRDNKDYEWVLIGNKVWMAENLAYLPSVSPPSEGSISEPFYYVYGYEGSRVSDAISNDNYATYGVLYNWPAAMNACPDGWHLPTDAEWTELIDYLGGEDLADVMLKETGTSHWISPNEGATNETGFTALPGGYNSIRGWGSGLGFHDIGYSGRWWSSTEVEEYTDIFARSLGISTSIVQVSSYDSKMAGFSVRCVEGPPPPPPQPPVADFIAERTSVTIVQGASVQFKDKSANDPTSWNWDFGDGTTSFQQHPKHSYTTTGTYTVSLTVTNAGGTDTKTKSEYITVIPGTDITTQTGAFEDSRDGKTYKTVTIGAQTWMAENLAYLPSVSPSSEGSYTDPYFYVYGYQGSSVSEAQATDNYANYGVLYNWQAAMIACPAGWHLPSNDEWTQLTDNLTANDYYDLGTVLKSTSFRGTDNLGFTALPGGLSYSGDNGYFTSIYSDGYWWSSTEYVYNNAWYRYMNRYSSKVKWNINSMSWGMSVRCLKD